MLVLFTNRKCKVQSSGGGSNRFINFLSIGFSDLIEKSSLSLHSIGGNFDLSLVDNLLEPLVICDHLREYRKLVITISWDLCVVVVKMFNISAVTFNETEER
jgi:hypothetical protein